MKASVSTYAGTVSIAWRTLASVKRDDRLWALLDEAVGAGPCDGGCLICARAIQDVFGGRIVHLARNGRPDHFGVLIDGCLLDFDGPAADPDFWKARFAELEGVTETLDYIPHPAVSTDIPNDPTTINALARLIREHRTSTRS